MLRAVTIRTNIFSNILFVVVTVAGSLLALQYHFSKTMAYEATQRGFLDAAEKITLDLRDRDRLVKTVLSELSYDNAYIDFSGVFPLKTVRRLTYTMARFKRIYAINIGNPYGDLFEVVNMAGRERLYKTYHAPPRTRWSVIYIHDTPQGRIKRFDYLDEDLKRVFGRSEPSDFDVTTRPWYTKALESGGLYRTLPYRFENLKEEGITYSKTVGASHNVVAIDLTISDLDNLLKEELFVPEAQIYLFDGNGTIIAATTKKPALDPPMLEAVRQKESGRVFTASVNGKKRFMRVTQLLEGIGKNLYLGFSVPVEAMMGPYLQKILYAFAAALLALLFAIPLILHTTARIVRPIKALMRENKKIKSRRFEAVKPVSTRIVELMQLSDSLVLMSESIRAYEESLKEMMESFIKLIAGAIDAKSPYTGGHCKRVPVIALMLAKAASASREGEFEAFRFDSDEALKEFELGAWLHDCGKITTPEYVVDKATKLETIHNRIHEIRTRFEVIWRDVEIEFYERLIAGEEKERLERWKEKEHQKLMEEFRFIAQCNLGSEFMSEEKKEKIRSIAKRKWIRHFDHMLGLSEIERERYRYVRKKEPPVEENLLADRPEHLVERYDFDEEGYTKRGFKLKVPKYLYNRGEIHNLCIEKGTLTEEERFKIEEHVIMTIRMLEQLPYPPGMEKIPEYAGTHHETMDGTGYPRKLDKERLSIPARIMAIADIFEALTASDRPYKKMKTLSEALRIMAAMVREGHLDAEIFKLFLRSGIYKEYAQKYLKPEQIDAVDIDRILNESTMKMVQ
ncbi:HD domain-containing phosphohydrolase [Hydrogenimonas urashimensis]|uniref:HD domain-containing phosphohydrolase n=1 Tax=Hydrogenimonas urashimensis TaxID=2740515 RepID=UPI001916634E|nr:HD domain-containing phosphohydrolase [Hydrogenimonas urashimensis]